VLPFGLAFRMTHRSWAEAQNDPPVSPAAIDKRLGHTDKGGEALEAIRGSRIGRSTTETWESA
jgi:hypothetical protein